LDRTELLGIASPTLPAPLEVFILQPLRAVAAQPQKRHVEQRISLKFEEKVFANEKKGVTCSEASVVDVAKDKIPTAINREPALPSM